jgi:hypothetical protein
VGPFGASRNDQRLLVEIQLDDRCVGDVPALGVSAAGGHTPSLTGFPTLDGTFEQRRRVDGECGAMVRTCLLATICSLLR